MPRPTFPVLVLLALCLLPACPTVRNPAFCDSETPCQDGWTCDVTYNRCIPPSGMECSDSDACMRTDEPICDLTANPSVCVACTQDQQCRDRNGDAAPFCDRNSGECIAMEPPDCTESEQCTASPTAPICDVDEGICKPCNEAGDDTACEMRAGGVAPFCADDGACVECLQPSDCNEGKPVCAANNACAGCTEHVHCAAYSGVCGDAGACAPEENVIYVVKNATDTETCSRATPCGELNDALALVTATRRFIVIEDETPGIYAEHLTIAPPVADVTIVGNGATILGTDNDAVIDVSGGAVLSLAGLTVDHANTGNLSQGIQCQGSKLSIESTIVQGAAGIGVSVNGCSLEIERSMITANLGGGIDVRDSSFSIVNSFITNNGKDTGTPTSNLGGVRIVNVDPFEPQFFAFNTVAENRGGPGAAASGVQCSVNPTSTVAVTSSIVRKGFGGRPTLAGDCVWRNSNVEDGAAVSALAPTEMGNNYMDCALADDGNGVFRIDAGTSCDNAGQPDTGILVDYEGKTRSATSPDMGADELDDDAAP